jgi:hypothetical protein
MSSSDQGRSFTAVPVADPDGIEMQTVGPSSAGGGGGGGNTPSASGWSVAWIGRLALRIVLGITLLVSVIALLQIESNSSHIRKALADGASSVLPPWPVPSDEGGGEGTGSGTAGGDGGSGSGSGSGGGDDPIPSDGGVAAFEAAVAYHARAPGMFPLYTLGTDEILMEVRTDQLRTKVGESFRGYVLAQVWYWFF